jgi:serine protease Do
LEAIGGEDEEGASGVKIAMVYPLSAAARGGVLINDVVTHFNGEEVESVEDLIGKVTKFHPGDEVKLTVQRRGKSIELTATLTGPLDSMELGGGGPSRSDFQNSLGGDLSELRSGFPTILQHDSILRPEDCGGPLVNLDGKVVGFNIARAGRVESYAIPTGAIMPIIADMMSGKLAPPGIVEEANEAEAQEVSVPAEAASDGQ